jgi:hypothetical protein
MKSNAAWPVSKISSSIDALYSWSGGIESTSIPLIPAEAGIQGQGKQDLDSRVRGNERNML